MDSKPLMLCEKVKPKNCYDKRTTDFYKYERFSDSLFGFL